MREHCGFVIGVYEKALPASMTWPQRLDAVRQAGFDYLEMSIDESEQRLARLDWDARQRAQLRETVCDLGIPITSMCLSGHRRYPMGSASAAVRQMGMDLLYRSIDLAADLGVRIILVPGYDVFYEPSDTSTRARFLDSLRQGIVWASCRGVMLAMENTDLNITSVSGTLSYVRALNSPWLQLYLDIGNLVAAGEDVFREIETGAGHLAGVHVKDAAPGQFRHIPLGEGTVPFVDAFQKLWKVGFSGPITLEMWETGAEGIVTTLSAARQWIEARIDESRMGRGASVKPTQQETIRS